VSAYVISQESMDTLGKAVAGLLLGGASKAPLFAFIFCVYEIETPDIIQPNSICMLSYSFL